MSDWTKEPWKVVDCDEYAEVVMASDDPSFDGGLIATIHRGGDISYLADAHRIVSCVNALAGFPDPQADVQALVESATKALEQFDKCTMFDADGSAFDRLREAIVRLRREP